MGKYTPLKEFLLEQSKERISMTFAQIEAVLNARLPDSKRYPAWWSNNAFNNTMTLEWLAAGYQSESVDIAGETLVFRKVAGAETSGRGPKRLAGHYPIFGCMKGTLTLLPEVDLTAAADPHWGDVYDAA